VTWRPLAAVVLFLVLLATPARADVLLTPYLGQSWSGIINDAHAGYPTTYGVRAEWFSRGVFGVGADYARTPDFLADADGRVRDSTVSTLMGTVTIGSPLPASGGFQPYLSGGAGVMRFEVERSGGGDDSRTDFAFNIGAGANVFFTRNFGANIDFRYLRNTQDFDLAGLQFEEKIVEYARWSGGLVFRF